MMDNHLGQLRHAYAQLARGEVRDQKAFADGLLAPVIRALEMEARLIPPEMVRQFRRVGPWPR